LRAIAQHERRPVADSIFQAHTSLCITSVLPGPQQRSAYTTKLYTLARANWRRLNGEDRLA
jgi:hypothetical protein